MIVAWPTLPRRDAFPAPHGHATCGRPGVDVSAAPHHPAAGRASAR
ncbi:hypothetical protein ACFQ0B_75745 [Nonomuraea thailandensis]